MEKDYKLVVTKAELVDIIYKLSNESDCEKMFKKMTNEEIINEIDNASGLVSRKCSVNDKIYYLKVDSDKYVYFHLNNKKSEFERDFVSQIAYILDNNLNSGKMENELKFLKNEYRSILNFFEENKKSEYEKLREYDLVKVLKNNADYFDISRKDIDEIRYWLNLKNISDNEQIMIRLVILYGIVNMYFKNSDYNNEKVTLDSNSIEIIDGKFYKAKETNNINEFMEKINEYIAFIRENRNKIKDEWLYSNDVDKRINLYAMLQENGKVKRINEFYSDIKKCDITKFVTQSFNNLNMMLRYINFDYYISNSRFDEAKEIYEMDLPIFNYFRELENKEDSKDMIKYMIGIIFEETENLNESELKLLQSDEVSYDWFYKKEISPFTKRNLKVMLRFYISCYYYFKHFKEEKNAENVIEFLLYFKKLYGIDNFILVTQYAKMVEEISGLKIENVIDDDEKVNEAIEKINKYIEEMQLISKFDVDEVIKRYTYINFDKLHPRVKRYVATGDKIMDTFAKFDYKEFDYSCAVIEWCKAVELEAYEKIITKISNKNINDMKKFYNFRYDSEKASDSPIGAIKYIMNNKQKYKVLSYLYDNCFSKIYKENFTKEEYTELLDEISKISDHRNKSAHKEIIFTEESAISCKNKILEVRKILEKLSKIEKKN